MFVDDLKFNLKPARELGMATVHHTSARETARALDELSGPERFGQPPATNRPSPPRQALTSASMSGPNARASVRRTRSRALRSADSSPAVTSGTPADRQTLARATVAYSSLK